MTSSSLPDAPPAPSHGSAPPPPLPDRRWPPSLPDAALGFAAGVFLTALVLARPSIAGLAALLREEHLLSNLQAAVTTGAILVGGWWTYARFVRTREDQPRLAVSHAIDCVRLDPRRTLVHVTAWVENRGSGLVTVSGIETRLQHVHPVHDALLTTLVGQWQDGDGCLVPWRTIATRRHTRGTHQLEPGEREYAAFDFVVDGRLEVASCYTFVPAAGLDGGAAPGDRMGWSCRTLYRIPAPAPPSRLPSTEARRPPHSTAGSTAGGCHA